MSGFSVLVRREYALGFRSPLAWVLLVGFHLFHGLAWRSLVGDWQEAARRATRLGGSPPPPFAEAVLEPYFLSLVFSLLLFTPFVTMRLGAEERRTGFEDLLRSLPVSARDVIAAKLAYAAGLVAALVGPSVALPLALVGVAPVEPGVLLAGALGASLCGLVLVSLGVWASSLTESQAVAAVLALTLALALFFGDRFFSLAEWISLRLTHEPFGRGVVTLRGLVWFGFLAAAFSVWSWVLFRDRRAS